MWPSSQLPGPAPDDHGPGGRRLIHYTVSLAHWCTYEAQQGCWCGSSLTTLVLGPLAPTASASLCCIRTFVAVEQPHRQLHIFERHAVIPVPERQQHGSRFASTCKHITVLREMRLYQEAEIAPSPHWRRVAWLTSGAEQIRYHSRCVATGCVPHLLGRSPTAHALATRACLALHARRR